MRLLIIEDNIELANSMKMGLEKWDFILMYLIQGQMEKKKLV